MAPEFRAKALEAVALMFEGESVVDQEVGAVELVEPEGKPAYLLVYLETEVLRFTVDFEKSLR
jgi:hypothetical protein